MNWYTTHKAKIAQAHDLTTQGDFTAAFAALDEAEAIRVGEMQRMKASQDAADLLHPLKVRAALEALDFSQPVQADLGHELLRRVSMSSFLIQQSVEVAAEDIATEGPEKWSYWLLYLLIALRGKGAGEDSYRGVLKRLRSDIDSHLSK